MLSRPRVNHLLAKALDYRLTILQAGPGYGKSTALAQLAVEISPLLWYQTTEEDSDPLIFLAHLYSAAANALPGLFGELSQPDFFQLVNWSTSPGGLKSAEPILWRHVIDHLINVLCGHFERTNQQPALFIVDDAHLVLESGEVPLLLDRFISLVPASLHILLSGRPFIGLPSLSRWRAQGEVLFLDQSDLIFTLSEISSLFSVHYGVELTQEEAASLSAFTEGWAVALQLIWQSIRSHPISLLEFSMERKAPSLQALFEILASEVFLRQPSDVRNFLLITAILRNLDAESCDALRRANDSNAMLAYLKRQELFVVETSGGLLRYHHIFHTFLRQQSPLNQRITWHFDAATYFNTHKEPEEAIYHLIQAQAWEETANILNLYAPVLVASGRLEAAASYLMALPPETLSVNPLLVFTLGELARLHSRFDEALGWYKQAESIWRVNRQQDGIARALRGQARVYLDTVNPSQAEKLLEEAIYLSDGFADREAQVRLYELLAENKLNSGRVAEAESLRQRAKALRMEGPTNEQLWFRVLLRTGRLNEARWELEKHAQTEKLSPVQTPRAHRETMLILSLIYSFMGQGDLAYNAALEGGLRGEELKSPFITAVGHMRQGHALLLPSAGLNQELRLNKAQLEFEKSIEIGQSLNVPRLQVEANWGLCRLIGYSGDISSAQRYAQKAIQIATQAGDEWIASLTRLTMGASLALAARYEAAADWLNRALAGFDECSDVFGRTVGNLWLAFCYLKQRDTAQLKRLLPEILAACQENCYDFLFLRPSLLGPTDERLFIPLLLYARSHPGNVSIYIDRLLEAMGLENIEYHPGYCLRIQTLGAFQLWRGQEILPSSSWRREKARLLFQILLTFRHMPLDRDQICEFLWPLSDPATAQRNFKITLNTLFQVLEPERDPGTDSAYIVREGSTYALRPNADIVLDAEEFIRASRGQHTQAGRTVPFYAIPPSASGLIAAGITDTTPQDMWRRAVELYQGEYLPDTRYESWAADERAHLATIFLETADKLANHLLQQNDFQPAIELCQRILIQDNCWERAYRYLMVAYARTGNLGQVGRIYLRCQQTLKDELDVSPSPETDTLFYQLTNQSDLN